MSTRRLGFVTIGQSPRDDILPGMLPHLPPDVELLQAGALDGIQPDQLAAMAPMPGDYVLTTRLADGRAVTVARQRVLPRLQAAVNSVTDRGAEVVAILCTGTFSDLTSRSLLVEPERVFHAFCAGVAGSGHLGAIIPLPAQVPQAVARWHDAGVRATVIAASPYEETTSLVSAAHKLKDAGVTAVAMDCFGFTEEMRGLVKGVTGTPVILANTYLARVLAELVAG
jgi:protein AroM